MKALTAVALLSLSAPAPADGVEPLHRVLVIHSFGRDFAPFNVAANEFRTELARRSAQPVEFFEASLEMARFDGAEKDAPLLDFLKAAFDERAPALLAPVGAPATHFCLRNRDALFPQVPLLVVGADQRRLQGMEAGGEFAAFGVELDLTLFLKDILTVLPELRHLFVVSGAAPLEQFWETELRREWPGLAEQVTFHWLSDQSVEQMRSTLRQVPPDSAVFFAVLNRDAAGIPHIRDSALAAIREASAAPVFGYTMDETELGVVGGRILPMKQVGAAAAAAAAALLAGKAMSEIHPAMLPLGTPLYDWRELRRWSIPESRLPVGSKVLFRPPGLWQTHRTAFLTGLAIIVVQSGLIVLLMTARRRARDSEAGLRLTTEAANVGLWEHRRGAADEIHASPEWRRMLRLPKRGVLRTEHVLQRIHPEDLPAVRESIERARREGLNFDLEHRIVLPGGEVRWIASHGRTEQATGGQRARGVSMDITERKRSEAEAARQRGELAHLSRVASLGALSGALAHELNQPLGSILSNAQAALRLLARNPSDLDEVREILADIVSEDRRAGDVIRRLRALLKRGETDLQKLDISKCIEEVLELVHAELIARGVSVVRAFADDLVGIMADRVQMQQVLLNLVANACDAMDSRPAGKRVLTLRASPEGNSVHVEVQDSGVGLQEPAANLFQPFHTTKPKGLGMGLAICRTIVDAHQGRLWAEACQEGGAVFHLTLPAAPPA